MGIAPNIDSDQLIERLNVLIRELEQLRNQISQLTGAGVNPATSPSANVTDRLYGALGQGSWDEYDHFADYERFGA